LGGTQTVVTASKKDKGKKKGGECSGKEKSRHDLENHAGGGSNIRECNFSHEREIRGLPVRERRGGPEQERRQKKEREKYKAQKFIGERGCHNKTRIHEVKPGKRLRTAKRVGTSHGRDYPERGTNVWRNRTIIRHP